MSGRHTYARTVNEFILTPYREYMFFKACKQGQLRFLYKTAYRNLILPYKKPF